MKIQVYGLKNCDSCKKAVKALMATGQDVELVDIRENPLSEGDIHALFDLLGDRLLNTRSTTWRSLSDAERAGAPVTLIVEHPTLMRRPVVQQGDRRTLGWDAKTQAEWV
ncbi:MAG: ArsC/Spx/MgsR family protein [Pseudomonadota bacterium]